MYVFVIFPKSRVRRGSFGVLVFVLLTGIQWPGHVADVKGEFRFWILVRIAVAVAVGKTVLTGVEQNCQHEVT